MQKLTSERVTVVVSAASLAITFTLIAFVAATLPAKATPQIAKDNGEPCMKCHTAPPALNAYGQKYKGNMKK